MLPYPLLIIIIVIIIIVTMIDNNAFGFNNCYFGIISGLKKKTIFLILQKVKHIEYLNFNSTSWGQGGKGILHNQCLLNVSELMNKDLSQNKVHNYFNIGGATSLAKVKEK